MKQRILKFLLVAIITLVAYNCQNDDELNLEEAVENNITVEHISSKNLGARTALKIKEKAKQIQKIRELLPNSQNKFVYNNELGVYIDLDNGKLVNNNGKLYYTYPMYRDSEDKLENIVFTVLDNGEIETFFVKYNVTPKQFDELSIVEQQNLTPQFQKVSTNGNPEYICVDFIQTITIYGQCEETHQNGVTCEGETTTYTTSFCNWTSGGSNNTGNNTGNNTNNNTNNNTSNTNYGNGNTIGSNGISTTPISPGALLIFELSSVLNLTPEMSAWLDNKKNWGKGEQIKKFLEEEGGCFILDMQGNTSSPECQQATTIAEAILNALIANPDLSFEEALFENGIYELPDNGETIIDPSEELECFDLTQGAKFTVYIQQPWENSDAVVGANEVGHAFIGIEQGGIVRQIGYYPDQDPGFMGVGEDYDAAIKTNYNYFYHVSISQNISSTQLTNIVNYAINFPPTYNTNNYACTDFAIATGNLGGLNLPSTTVSFSTFTGRSPGVLGQEIRAMTSTDETLITTESTSSPERQGNCD